MRISKMNRSIAFCISFFAASFIFATAAGSFVLATIPAQNVRSGVSAKTGSGNQDIDKAKMESQAPQLRKEIKYALLCGIIGGRRDKADGQPIPPPPPPKDEKGRVGQCLLLDISTPKASLVSGEFEASRLIHRVDPVYPESAIRGHVGIRVVVHMSINEEGLVTDAEVMQSQTVPPDRDSKGNWVGGVRASVIKSVTNAAINAVRQWKYSPTLLNGQAIPVGASASIAFTFNKDGAPVITAYAP